MAKQQKQWGYSPSASKKPKVPESVRQTVKTRADELIETLLKPRYTEAPPTKSDRNCLIDLYSKWYRNCFYFCAMYRCVGPHAISPAFETKFARMEYQPNGLYTVSYFRHTEKWWELYHDLTMEESFQRICEEPHFYP